MPSILKHWYMLGLKLHKSHAFSVTWVTEKFKLNISNAPGLNHIYIPLQVKGSFWSRTRRQFIRSGAPVLTPIFTRTGLSSWWLSTRRSSRWQMWWSPHKNWPINVMMAAPLTSRWDTHLTNIWAEYRNFSIGNKRKLGIIVAFISIRKVQTTS